MKNQPLPFNHAETREKKIHDPIQDDALDIIEWVTQRTEASGTIEGLVIGKIETFDEQGCPYVSFPMNPCGHALASRTTVNLNENHKNREVALMFENNNARKPVIIGLMNDNNLKIEKDGEVIEISSEKEIHLRCGDSSIQMKSDGQIIIKGREIISRARGNHRVQGGTVHIN